MHERPRGKYARGEPEETRARSALRALVQHPCENFLFDTPWIAWRRLPAAQEIDGMKFFVLLVDAHGFSVLFSGSGSFIALHQPCRYTASLGGACADP